MHANLLPRTYVAVALALVTSASTVARAGDVSPGAIEKSSALYKQARALQTHGKWAEAEAAYQAAWDIRKTFDIAGNLGDCEMHVGQPREAAEHLAYALKNVPAGVAVEQTEALNKLLQEARQQIGTLNVTANVTGAQVFVDGRPVGEASSDPIFVDPGAHSVEARLVGYKPGEVRVEALKGSSQNVALELVADAAPGPRKPVVITGAVLGGAGIVVGAVFTVLANAKASDATAKDAAIVKIGPSAACGATPSASCQALQSALRDQATFSNVAAWSFIAGGAVGAGTVIYALVAPRSAKTSGMRVAPFVAANGGGVVLRGEW